MLFLVASRLHCSDRLAVSFVLCSMTAYKQIGRDLANLGGDFSAARRRQAIPLTVIARSGATRQSSAAYPSHSALDCLAALAMTKAQSANGSRTRIVSSRSGLVETRATGQRINSSMR